jgi:uncharacterized protein (TIGR02145 family)
MAGRTGPGLIGNKSWVLKNLDVTTFSNGDPIPQVAPSAFSSLSTPAWCYYNNSSANGDIYGKIYNFYAYTDSRGLAPKGYRISTIQDWDDAINKYQSQIEPLRSTTTWNAGGGTNFSGLNVKAGGLIISGFSTQIGDSIVFFCSLSTNNAIQIFPTSTSVDNISPGFGAYVRLVKN